ncbi:hypothetical protein ACQEWB_20505 [Streptomyces sp. CA-249302]|uniref:hypothetical protein n=1 Tax=Streptomyces sp. CA-249302 TaxID=3240058 RepID=UPI003D9295E5
MLDDARAARRPEQACGRAPVGSRSRTNPIKGRIAQWAAASGMTLAGFTQGNITGATT